MKTEQEQINKMAQIMCDCCDTDGKCWGNHLCTKINIQDCRYKENAEQLTKAGYGNILEYKTEIGQLKAENKKEFENFVKINDELLKANVALSLGKKQAQINILNKVKEKFEGYEATSYNGYEEGWHDLQEEIDEIIKEIEE